MGECDEEARYRGVICLSRQVREQITVQVSDSSGQLVQIGVSTCKRGEQGQVEVQGSYPRPEVVMPPEGLILREQ